MNQRLLSDRDIRQRDIIPPERLATVHATVVGVGAIGRQVALQLAAMGVPRLQLIDPDTVEPANLACQGYLEEDLEQPKVEATAGLCCQINEALVVELVPKRFRRSMQVGSVLFCCVDAIETRRLVWEAVRDRVEFFADGRMAAEVLRVLVACDGPSHEHYATTLFAAAEVYAGSCTARSTIYCANVAAGLMVAQFAKWLRGLPVEQDIQLNLLSSEMSVTEPR